MSDQPSPSFREALRFWLKLGFISFGGPAGQIAIMHTELVEKKKWIGEERFLHALNYCMLLPGPEATQLATYCGWLLHRTRGGLAAGILFILPSAVLLWALSWIYVVYGRIDWIAAAFAGLKPAVAAIVASATLRIGKRALTRPLQWSLAAGAFIALFFFHAPFPLVIASAALIGLIAHRISAAASKTPPASTAALAKTSATAVLPAHGWARAARVIFVASVLWWAPVIIMGLWQGWKSTWAQEGVFFSKAAMVTFGGAYAVLPYVSQQAVEHYGWLSTSQMLDGLGLAETTPGPLIMVLQFVGFLGGWNQPGGLPPLVAGTLGAFITTWTTFVPCFLWIFLGAPYIERTRDVAVVNRALSAVTASVVGVILNLAVWFGWHVLFAAGHIQVFPLAIAIGSFLALQSNRAGLPLVIAGSALAGVAQYFI